MNYISKNVADTMKQEKDWFKILEPELKKHFFKRGSFYMVENNNECSFNKTLDCVAGIDLWYCDDRGYIVGVASRIQKYKKNKYGNVTEYKTFTIRKERESGFKTEYEKRLEAIAFERLYPTYTVQAYLAEDKDELKCFAVARTKDILQYISENTATNNTGNDQIGQAEFYVIDWYEFEKVNPNIVIKKY